MTVFRRLRERVHAMLRPRGTENVMQILHGLAILDDQLDERELTFILSFAKRWGFDPGEVLRTHDSAHPVEAASFTSLHAAMREYLATKPAIDQAQQLRDLLTSLVTIDGRICEREELMMEELGRMIDSFVGVKDRAAFTVFVTPPDTLQAARVDAMPALPERPGDTGTSSAGAYHSRAYAELVCGWYRDAGYQAVIEQPGLSNERSAEPPG